MLFNSLNVIKFHKSYFFYKQRPIILGPISFLNLLVYNWTDIYTEHHLGHHSHRCCSAHNSSSHNHLKSKANLKPTWPNTYSVQYCIFLYCHELPGWRLWDLPCSYGKWLEPPTEHVTQARVEIIHRYRKLITSNMEGYFTSCGQACWALAIHVLCYNIKLNYCRKRLQPLQLHDLR